MTWAVCRTQWLALARDRGALVMGFVLPVVVFLVFAAIFAAASGDELRLKVALADEAGSALSGRLATAVEHDGSLRVTRAAPAEGARVSAMVAAGTVDVGVVIRRGGRALDTLSGEGPSPVIVVAHPTRVVAGAIAAGAVQRAYFSAMPDAALRGVVALIDEAIVPLTPAQRAEASAQLDQMVPDPSATGTAGGLSAFDALVEQQRASALGGATDKAAYYAGAVAALFMLLAAVTPASSLHDELSSGVADRVVAGPAGLGALVDGRFLFLVLQGLAQAVVIFGVASLGAGVEVSGRLLPLCAVAVGLAAAASGIALLVSALSHTARQTITAANVAILVASAVGGSMVPRFLMPPWLQDLGWLTPNGWAIDGFAQALGPGPWSGIASSVAVLLGGGLLSWAVARRLWRRFESL